MQTTWLMAYDFSPIAQHALETALAMLTRQGGGRLLLAHSHPHGTTADGVSIDLGTLGTGSAVDLEQRYFDSASEQLSALATRLATPLVSIEPHVVRGHPADVIPRLAEEHGCELVVVGSHGRRGFKRLLLGSVAENIVRHVACSVLVVKPA